MTPPLLLTLWYLAAGLFMALIALDVCHDVKPWKRALIAAVTVVLWAPGLVVGVALVLWEAWADGREA